ncbi:hypothetical protein AB9P05_00055 [Roseivirga sp. BDSF3-8]|uniref:hypothetical protein n=1 Tax=Roseivirga sp. BDSF3-8 TaxID=3241598 RepID=UPI003531E561
MEEVTPYQQIHKNFQALEPLEAELKAMINRALSEENFDELFSREVQQQLRDYTRRPLKYFANEVYLEANLEKLGNALGLLPELLSANIFMKKKRLLDYQARLAESRVEA